jgi:8-oxo-dGTP diphosphatase
MGFIPLNPIKPRVRQTEHPGYLEMDKRPLIGVAVIVIKENRVLLGKRKNAHGADTWAFPGGHLEFNESIFDCAVREVFEETGLRIKNLRFGPYTNDIFTAEDKHYVTLFVIADHDSGEPEVKEPRKCETWQWSKWPPVQQSLFLPIRNLLEQDFSLPA